MAHKLDIDHAFGILQDAGYDTSTIKNKQPVSVQMIKFYTGPKLGEFYQDCISIKLSDTVPPAALDKIKSAIENALNSVEETTDKRLEDFLKGTHDDAQFKTHFGEAEDYKDVFNIVVTAPKMKGRIIWNGVELHRVL